jgi:vitamin B12/bleomycin/antimicrobial peptide transport system ATP-binding/permease protein
MQHKNNFFISFMRLAGPYWNSKNKLVIRIETVLLILLTVFQIGL